jgi:glycerophosphoryl diester phosphodiesterase
MTVIVAHRGASTVAPENTMEAFRAGVAAGADAIELDVHLTADGVLAVIHDETLERTTDRTEAVVGLSFDDIRSADAGFAFTDADGEHPFRGTGLTVPTLGEVLDWLPAEVGLVVEIKAVAAADATVEALRGREERTTIISFDERAINRVRELNPGLATGLLLVPGDSFERGLAYAVEHGHTGIHPYEADLGLDPSAFLQAAAAWERQVGCYVVNDPDRMLVLTAAGLWGFVTDDPALARATLDARPELGP